MINWSDTIKALEDYRNYVLTQAKRNLTMGKIKSGSRLYKSLRGIVAVKQARSLTGRFQSGKQPQITFKMNDYGRFVDEGVQGTKEGATSKPYKFDKNKKSIPWDVVEGFVKKRARNPKTGRFQSKNTMLYLIGKSIHEKGIKRSLFFTRPLNKRRVSSANLIAKGAANDITREFTNQLRIYFKDNKTLTK